VSKKKESVFYYFLIWKDKCLLPTYPRRIKTM